MSWTFVNSGSNGSSGSATTLAASVASVQAGDVAIVGIKWEDGGPGTVTCSDGTSSLTEYAPAEQGVGGADQWIDMFYLLSSVATGTVTYTVTFNAARTWRGICAMAWRPSAAASLDGTAVQNDGTSAVVNSGNITTTGADGLAVGFYGEFGRTFSSVLINGVAVAQSVTNSASGQKDQMFARTYSAGFTGAASGGLDASEQWNVGLLAFNIGGGGAAFIARRNAPQLQAVKRASLY